jgi:hypothetical protein
VNEDSTWPAFIAHVAEGVPNGRIAAAVGVHTSTIGRWKTGATTPAPTEAVRFARAYGVNPIDALLAAGLVTHEEMGLERMEPKSRVEDIDSVSLASELLRRVKEQQVPKRPSLSIVGGPSDDELREMPLEGLDQAAGNDQTTDDEDTSTP